MPKKIIISSESSNLYTTKRLMAEGDKLKRSTTWINPYSSSLSIANKIAPNGTYLIRTTGVRYDDFDLTCARRYAFLKYKIVNPVESIITFRSKELQAIFFNEQQLNSIPSFMYRGALTDSMWEALLKLSPSGDYILKMSRGNQGIGVNLVRGKQSLRSFLDTFHAMKDQRFLIQPFVGHKKELRVFMIKHEIQAIVERTISAGDFRGNAKRSAGKIIKKIPKSLRDELTRASVESGLSYCGIDLIYDGDDFIFLEINPVPGFEQIEILSKKNIARELITQLE